jgi:hypothetical protein
LFAPSALALDAACDPTDPDYTPHTGEHYVNPAGEVRFCTSLDNPAAAKNIDETQPMSCLLELDLNPYATATNLQPGQEIIISVDEVDRSKTSEARLTCTAFMIALDGSTHERSSDPVVFTFDPVPVPEPPVPLQP